MLFATFGFVQLTSMFCSKTYLNTCTQTQPHPFQILLVERNIHRCCVYTMPLHSDTHTRTHTHTHTHTHTIALFPCRHASNSAYRPIKYTHVHLRTRTLFRNSLHPLHTCTLHLRTRTLCRNSLHSAFPSGLLALKLAGSTGSVAGHQSLTSTPLRMPRNLLETCTAEKQAGMDCDD